MKKIKNIDLNLVSAGLSVKQGIAVGGGALSVITLGWGAYEFFGKKKSLAEIEYFGQSWNNCIKPNAKRLSDYVSQVKLPAFNFKMPSFKTSSQD